MNSNQLIKAGVLILLGIFVFNGIVFYLRKVKADKLPDLAQSSNEVSPSPSTSPVPSPSTSPVPSPVPSPSPPPVLSLVPSFVPSPVPSPSPNYQVITIPYRTDRPCWNLRQFPCYDEYCLYPERYSVKSGENVYFLGDVGTFFKVQNSQGLIGYIDRNAIY